MRNRRCVLVMVLCLGGVLPLAGQRRPPSRRAVVRIQKEVRHQLAMLPYYDVFDHLAFRVDGYRVTLLGQVTRPSLKRDAEQVVKRVEGVERVNNRIEVLPVSPMDDRLREQLFRSIYGFASLQKYGVGSNKSIHIIVKHGHVTLEGVVDNQADRNLANMRANSVFGVFSVTNHLQVVRE